MLIAILAMPSTEGLSALTNSATDTLSNWTPRRSFLVSIIYFELYDAVDAGGLDGLVGMGCIEGRSFGRALGNFLRGKSWRIVEVLPGRLERTSTKTAKAASPISPAAPHRTLAL